MHLQEVPLEYHTHYNPRDGARSENLSRQVVMRRAATARRRLLMWRLFFKMLQNTWNRIFFDNGHF